MSHAARRRCNACRQSGRGPPGAVIEGKAKRYKLDDGSEAGQQYTAAQV